MRYNFHLYNSCVIAGTEQPLISVCNLVHCFYTAYLLCFVFDNLTAAIDVLHLYRPYCLIVHLLDLGTCVGPSKLHQQCL